MRLFLLLPSLFLCMVALAQNIAKVSPCLTDSNYNRLDFWVGEWDVYRNDTLLVGQNILEKRLDDCVLF